MGPRRPPFASSEGEDGRAVEAQGGNGSGAGQQEQPQPLPAEDASWASQLWMENAHWALLGEHHPDRYVGWDGHLSVAD